TKRRGKFSTIFFARSLEIPFLPRAHRRDLEADCPYYCGQKMSRAADRRPRARPRAWLIPPAAESFLPDRGQKISCRFSLVAARVGRTEGWDRRAALASDYWLIFLVVWAPLCVPVPPLASLVGFRSRTSICGLSFFSSL